MLNQEQIKFLLDNGANCLDSRYIVYPKLLQMLIDRETAPLITRLGEQEATIARLASALKQAETNLADIHKTATLIQEKTYWNTYRY